MKPHCSVQGCDRSVAAKGFCGTHYTRWRKHGDAHFKTKPGHTQHGHARVGAHTKEYRALHGLLKRCYNLASRDYPLYGGRGIAVCAEWRARRTGFPSFLAAMGLAPSPQHTIDRIDVNGDYTPDNCRWSTPTEQSRNRRDNIIIDGIIAKDWAAARGLNYYTVVDRYRAGDRGERLARPVTRGARKKRTEPGS